MAKDSLLNIILNIVKQGTGDKDASQGMQDLDRQLTNTATSLLSSVVGFASLTGAIYAGVAALKDCIDAASQAESVYARVTATIQSTGRGSETSSLQIEALATSMQGLFTKVDIEAAANVLMRYMDIPTAQIPADLVLIENMAAGLGVSLPEAAATLGQALETGRVRGLGFSRQMTDQISVLMKNGEVAAADAIIMDALNSKFSGQEAAALDTYAGKQAQVKTASVQLQETIGNGLLPTLKYLDDFLYKSLNGWNQFATAFFSGSQIIGNGEVQILNTLHERYGLVGADFLDMMNRLEGVSASGTKADNTLKSIDETLGRTAPAVDSNTKYVSSMKAEYDHLVTTLGQMDPRTMAVGMAFGILSDKMITDMVNLHNFDVALNAWGNTPITKDIIMKIWTNIVGGVNPEGPPTGPPSTTPKGGYTTSDAGGIWYVDDYGWSRNSYKTHSARGGPVAPGTVWDEGGNPEVLVTGSGGMIISHDEAVKAIGGAGGAQFIINYSPMVSFADEAEVKRRLAPLIDQLVQKSKGRI